jgi:succinate-semialdehyde dehydrogenase/glutarate-semialdehyde dehydrogenase
VTTIVQPHTLGTELRLIIGGASVGSAHRKTSPVFDPGTGEEIGRLPVATDEDLADALASSARGYRTWRATSAFERSAILGRAADLIRQRVDAIARTLTLEQGKPLAEARGEIIAAAEVIEWSGEEGRRTYGRVVPARAANVRQLVIREPIGPVVAFTPWNFPAITPARKLAGALGAGCSIIIKPSEETPSTALMLVEALFDAGVPADAINVVFGDPAHISSTLLASDIIRKVSFTGSTSVGKHIARLAADGMKRATLELGGHAPVIISKHADLAKAIATSVPTKFRNAGQVCVSPTRFIVQRSVYEEFVAGFTAKTEKLVLGHGLESTTTMGALANPRRVAGINALVKDAAERGATVNTGGAAVDAPGFFYQPTVVSDVPAGSRMLTEEPFGPLAIVTPFDDLGDAIAEANRLPYGLAAYAFTNDVAESIRLSDEIETGMLGINHFGVSFAEIPFGGVKDSGYGSEGGTEGLDSYLVTKSVTMT